MKKTLFNSLLFAAVLAMAPVMGNNCFYPCPQPYCWSGFYAGIQGGYGWGNPKTNVFPLPDPVTFSNLAPLDIKSELDGGFGGVEVGFNWQTGRFVLGFEADASASDISHSRRISPIIQFNGIPFPGAGFIESKQKIDWFGTLRYRMGYTVTDSLLIYATAGLAWGHTKYHALTNFLPLGTEMYPAHFNNTNVGWTVGAGLEYAFAQNWSIKAEYLYLDLGHRSTVSNPIPAAPPFQIRYRFNTQFNTARLGLNYKFSL